MKKVGRKMGFSIETQKIFHFVCDYCGKKVDYLTLHTAKDARSYGWAISKDYKKCYCPQCAPKFRNVGQVYGGVCSWR